MHPSPIITQSYYLGMNMMASVPNQWEVVLSYYLSPHPLPLQAMERLDVDNRDDS